MECATLNNGIKMPMAGIGTFLLTPDEAEASVLSALQCGYRLIDTANAYVNEKAVGRAMRKSGIPRDEIFLETKLWPSFYEQEDAVEKTLQRLGTDYIDLLLIHQPAGLAEVFIFGILADLGKLHRGAAARPEQFIEHGAAEHLERCGGAEPAAPRNGGGKVGIQPAAL